jgi:hypothetical protein
MNEEIKEQWVNALRSGEYTQGTGRLATIRPDHIEYCCLGVLCELAVKNGLAVKSVQSNSFFRYYSPNNINDSNTATLPNCVLEWAELKDRQGWSTNEDSLTSLNDHGKSFEEIAQVIEANL